MRRIFTFEPLQSSSGGGKHPNTPALITQRCSAGLQNFTAKLCHQHQNKLTVETTGSRRLCRFGL